MLLWDREWGRGILCYSAVLGKGIHMSAEECVMAHCLGRDKSLWLYTEMPQDLGIGISYWPVWFTIKCMLLVDITTELYLRLYNNYTSIDRLNMHHNISCKMSIFSSVIKLLNLEGDSILYWPCGLAWVFLVQFVYVQ